MGAALVVSPRTQAENYSLFLLGGQSNMVGRAQKANLPTQLLNPQDDVVFYYDSSGATTNEALKGQLTTLRPDSGTDFGPELTFGRTLADAMPDESIFLVKSAVGATTLETDWNHETGEIYAQFRDDVDDAINQITSLGHTYEIKGMIWTQGETDSTNLRTTEQYSQDLKELIGDIRRRYNDLMPFFISQLSLGQTSYPVANLNRIRGAQANVVDTDPYTWLIETDGLPIMADGKHFDALGQQMLGQAFAQSYLDSLPSGPLQELPGDLDQDGDVDDADLGTAFSNYTGPIGFNGGKTPADGDLDGDGDVDDSDLGGLFGNYTGALSSARIPEPGVGLCLVLGGLLVSERKNR